MKTRRVLLRTLAAMLTLALVLFGVVVMLLASERGTRWSLQIAQNYLPALTLKDASGDWLHGLRIEQLQWRDEDIDIRIDKLETRLRWPALLRSEIQLRPLRIGALRIEPLGESSDAPTKLTRLFLPTALSAPEFALRQLQIVDGDSSVALDDIGAAVRWRATTLRARNLHLNWQQLRLQASGSIGFRGDYPLQLKGSLLVPQFSDKPIAVETDGDLRRLLIRAGSDAPYPLRSEIHLATLDKHLPLAISAELSKPFEQPLPRGAIKIDSAALKAQGDLNRIEATLAAAISGPRYGSTQLNATAQWQPDRLQASAHWQLKDGSFDAECSATPSAALPTACSGKATTLPLAPLLNGRSGQLSGAFKLESQRVAQRWALTLQLPDLSGQIGNEPFSGQLDITSADGELWQLRKLELTDGPNRLSGSGKFGKQNQAQAEIKAGDLARLYPRLGGSLNANLTLSGEWPQPDLRAQWRGAQLRFDAATLARTQGELTLRRLGRDTSLLRIEAKQLAYPDYRPADLTLSISGERGRQQINLDAEQNAQQLALRCNTAPSANWLDWQIDCPELTGLLRARSIDERWRNNAPLSARLQLEQAQASPTEAAHYQLQSVELKPFCIRAREAEACLDQALRYARPTLQPISAHASALPLRWLTPWLPQQLQLQNDARADARVQLQNTAPLRAEAHLNIASTQWEWLAATGSRTAAVNAIAFDATLDEKRAYLTASAQSPTLGKLTAQLAIGDPRNRRELDGRVQLEHVQLGGFTAFTPELDELGGEIDADIRVLGTTRAPQLQGQMLLKDGFAKWAPLGAPFRTINADLTFNNNSAKLGGWFALGQGGGDISGDIRWDGLGDNWQANVALVAGGLSASPLPNSTVVFSPHIETSANNGEIHLKGYVDVASAEIELKQLPPETVDVSQDQQIIGESAEEAIKLWADLGLNLGDQFHFRGLGADVNLSGRLKIGKAPGDSLHVTGEVKVPRGRYRAYGQRLSVRKGSFIFYGPPDNPDLNLEAVREMPPGVTDVVGLRVIGSLKTPEALLFSEPSMPDSDIAYYLLTGHRPATNTSNNQFSASGALLSLGLAGSEGTAGKLAGKFGISDLQLGTSEDSSGNTEAAISGQLGHDLSVRYGRSLGQRSNSISLQYQLTPKLMIETISGIEDALDLLYSFEIK